MNVLNLIKDNQELDHRYYIDDDINLYKGNKHKIVSYKNKLDGYNYFTFVDADKDSETYSDIVALIVVKETRKFGSVKEPKVPSDYDFKINWTLETSPENGFRQKFKNYFMYTVKGIDENYSNLIHTMFFENENPHSEDTLNKMNISIVDKGTNEIIKTMKMTDDNFKDVHKTPKEIM